MAKKKNGLLGFAWVLAVACGVLAVVFYLALPALRFGDGDHAILTSGGKLAFGHDNVKGQWYGVVPFVILAVGALAALVGLAGKKNLLYCAALLLVVGAIFAFLTKSFYIAAAKKEMVIVVDSIVDALKKATHLGIGAILAGILGLVGAGAAVLGATAK